MVSPERVQESVSAAADYEEAHEHEFQAHVREAYVSRRIADCQLISTVAAVLAAASTAVLTLPTSEMARASMLVSLLASLTAISTASTIVWVMQGRTHPGLIVTSVRMRPEVSVHAGPIGTSVGGKGTSKKIAIHRHFDTEAETVTRVARLVDFPVVFLRVSLTAFFITVVAIVHATSHGNPTRFSIASRSVVSTSAAIGIGSSLWVWIEAHSLSGKFPNWRDRAVELRDQA